MVEVGYTEEEVAQWHFQEQERAKAIAQRFQLEGLLLVSAYFRISFSEWIRLPRPVQLALIQTAEGQARQEESMRRQKEKEIEEKMNQLTGTVRMPHPMPSALPHLMGYK